MEKFTERVRFASAPVSWGVQDDPGPAWEQPYERILDEIRSAGYTGTELGPYGFFPTDHTLLSENLRRRGMSMLSSFLPVPLADPSKKEAVLGQVRKVGALLAALGAGLLVLSDAQTPQRRSIAGHVPVNGRSSLSSEQWKAVGLLVGEIERAASEFGLRLMFHPHAATYVETPLEVERLFDSLSHTQVGLCLDTGHCVYGGGDPAEEAKKYRSLLRYIHIKDINARILGEARRRNFDFEQAIGAGIFSPIGEGCIDFASLFRLLAASGYSGWMVVEQDVIYGKAAVPPAESMRASLDYLKRVLFELESAKQSAARTA
jgi:inosose dehydratase